jgi:response regulator RpfG family c-di-GMP phosphodiesterase
MPSATQPAAQQHPTQELETLRAECERLRGVAERQTREFTALQASLEEAHRETHDGFMATVEVLASLIQAGTRDTVSVRKIAELAQSTAQILGLSEGQQRDIHLAGLFCDLGKLTLHEELIHTPVASMSAEQAAEFKRHTINAENILLPLKPLARVAAILRSHNERLDGSGYPDGLQGDAIPLESRVLHVVKDYDALTRRLILPEALTPAEAVRYLEDHTGKHYDSNVVAAFLRVLKLSKQDDNLRELRVSVIGLKPGMLVTRDLVNEHGVLMVPRGRRLDQLAIDTLQRIADGGDRFVLFVQR